MKRAAPLPFILRAALALAALFIPAGATTVPAGAELNAGDTAWMLASAALVLLMTPGLSFFYGGMVGFKNVVSTMLQSLVALGVIIALIGAAVAASLLARQKAAAPPSDREVDLTQSEV